MQKLINYFYRFPKSQLKNYHRFGGYINYRKMLGGRKLMIDASIDLPPVYSVQDGLPIYFLTGKNYLYQTLFCIQSLSKCCAEHFQFVLVDDGSFDNDIISRINRQLPGATIITQPQINKNLHNVLPATLYPNLHHKRQVYPHIKKLTDIHTLRGNKWKLVLDSDMLFWSRPDEMIEWLQSPDKPLYMTDCQNSYGYSKELMERLCGSAVRDLLNVGIVGMNSEAIDWNAIEQWIPEMEQREGTSYYLEQALTAMLIGNAPSLKLHESKYIVNPAENIIENKAGILHHYVDTSKAGYFNQAWKEIKQ